MEHPLCWVDLESCGCNKEDGLKSSNLLCSWGETLSTQAKSTGLGIVELASAFENIKPDLLITVADRFETMATAIATSYMNIPLAICKGRGWYWWSCKHSILIVRLPFCLFRKSAKVQSMGISLKNIFNFGCPAMDILKMKIFLYQIN